MGTDHKSTAKASKSTTKTAPFRLSASPLINSDGASEAANASEEEKSTTTASSSYENLGELPAFYQSGKIYLAARDPHWLFVYWDIDLEKLAQETKGDTVFQLHVHRSDGELVDRIRVNTQAQNWYFPIKDAGVSYSVELGWTTGNLSEKWVSIAKSNETFAPTDTFVDGPVEFASVPFHLSFDRMLEIVRTDLEAGNTLVGALSHLQNSNDRSLKKMADIWTAEQKLLLESLVGKDLVSQVGLGSPGSDQLFRKRLSDALSEKLSSPSGSEMSFLHSLSSTDWNLSSGVGASWSSAVGGSSEWIGGESSWSGGLGSSWSAQPFGSTGRDFFMHVNAEVIFYGGTHPDASVWIDGQQIALSPDGGFRYHFRLPDGEFEIPIVAESPDGVEIRSAKLVFKRDTTRTGKVDSTGQPGYLNTPPGAK